MMKIKQQNQMLSFFSILNVALCHIILPKMQSRNGSNLFCHFQKCGHCWLLIDVKCEINKYFDNFLLNPAAPFL